MQRCHNYIKQAALREKKGPQNTVVARSARIHQGPLKSGCLFSLFSLFRDQNNQSSQWRAFSSD